MNKVKLFLISIIICFFSCKAQNQTKSDKVEFSIVTDTIKCKSIDDNLFTTEYIKVNYPDKIHETKIQNKIDSFFLSDIYDNENIKSLKSYNKKCCNGSIENCDFNIQNYVINYTAPKFASITGFFNIYGVTPTEDEFNLNINTATLEIIELSNILSKEGIDFLIKDINQKILNSIEEEKQNWDDEELEEMDSFLATLPAVDSKSINNYKILKKGEYLYLKIWYSFNAANFQQDLLPVIDLTYKLDVLKPYYNNEGFKILNY